MAPTVIPVAMKLALLTGLRQEDISALRVANLTDDGLLVTPFKSVRYTGKRLLLEWTPEPAEAVAQVTEPRSKVARGNVCRPWLVWIHRRQRYTLGGS